VKFSLSNLARQQKLIALGMLAPAVVALALWLGTSGRGNATGEREVAVTRGAIAVTILANGAVRPRNRLEIKPPLAGRVEQVLVQEGQAVHKGQILAWMSSSERAALLDAARARGPEEVRRWEEFYKATPILSPIHGTVIKRSVEPGQSFTSADAVLVLSDRLIVQAQVDETDIAQVKPRQKARITLDAYPSETIPAEVGAVAYEAKTVSNVTTYTVDVLPEKVPAFMRSGMTASVAFQVASKEDVVRVPSHALKARDGNAYVLVAKDGGTREERAVQTGITDGKFTEVVEGLREGEKVLIAQLRAEKRTGTNPFATFGRPAQPKK
jgi:macrolide-specific efflux system membrane fusion protein